MKFDMKKRILALALAGTTAFSVFGAAMSANAADADKTTTHTYYGNDKYVSYDDVATKITVSNTAGTAVASGKYYDTNTAAEAYSSLDAAKAAASVKDNYVRTFTLTTPDGTKFAADDTEAIAAKIARMSKEDYASALGTMSITEDEEGFKYGGVTYGNLAEAIAVVIAADTENSVVSWNYARVEGSTATKETVTATEYAALPTWAEYEEEYIIAGPYTPYTGTVKVTTVRTDKTKFSNFSFDATIDDVMDTTVSPTGVVYAYDFYWVNDFESSVSTIAYDWNTLKDADKLAAAFAGTAESAKYEAETGTGNKYKGVRYEVVNEWVDFLDELAINADNGYSESYTEFVKNYTDLFYSEPIYSIKSGKLVSTNKVDLYNITELLYDIYALNSEEEYSKANTSELVYLMQQYDKYIGEYISKSEADTTEWGELLLSVLEAADEDNFKRANDYKKYTNKVEELADAYEAATTEAQITKAEQGMYDLLTSVPYTSATVSKTDLASAMSSLYFNIKSLTPTYNTAATVSGTGVVAYGLSGTTYTLYPMSDYYEYGNDNTVYTGNEGTTAYTADDSTDEYQWFYNVYELAYNMYKSNKYQGSVDAVTEALNEAVAALEVTQLPAGSNTLAKDEMVETYADLIESDYSATYYGYYTLANDFADVAEGAAQTKNATNMVKEAGATLTYQGAQVTITKNDIKTVKSAITDANTALTAIKADANYSAAQVNALNKAIAAAQNIVDLYEGTAYSKPSQYTQSVNKNGTTMVGDKDQIVKSDLDAAIAAIDAAINYSEVVMGWNQTANGWTYGTEDGYVESGWKQINSVWYYFENGVALQSTWKQIDGKWYYLNSNCGAAYGWAKVDGSWYYFGGDNAMKTGWVKVDGSWYYLNAGGKMVTGWAEVNGTWYYFSKESNALGQMLANTTTPDGYTVDANGALVD
jgi:glucan-binding YG repeat protein